MHPKIKNKQPKSLIYLFLTELWERFAYWSVQSLLVLYMTERLHFHDAFAYFLFSAFGALMMAMPVLGGYIADRMLGFERTIILGAILLIAGYYCLYFAEIPLFYLGMTLLICGNGTLKPNISALLGTCYLPKDARRQNGYTLFYVGINVGSLIGTILCGIIAKMVSYEAAFALSASVLLLGLSIFIGGKKQIRRDQKSAQYPPFHLPLKRVYLNLVWIVLAILVLIYPFYWCLHHPKITNLMLALIGGALLLYILYEVKLSSTQDRPAFLVAIILTIFSIVFWSIYMQMPMSLTLYVARDVNLHVFGFHIPASTVSSLNGFMILICTPFMIRLWNLLKSRQREPSIPTKFALGTLFIGLGFVVLALGTTHIKHQHLASLTTVILGYLGLTLGELALSPIGLAMISLYTPRRVKGLMMGTWFFAIAASYAIAGQLAKISSIPKTLNLPELTAPIYYQAFEKYAILGLGAGIIMLALSPFLNKMVANKSELIS